MGQQDEGIKLWRLWVPPDRPGQDLLVPPLRTDIPVFALVRWEQSSGCRRGASQEVPLTRTVSHPAPPAAPVQLQAPPAPRSRMPVGGSCSPGGTRPRSARGGRGCGAAPSWRGWEEVGHPMPGRGAVMPRLGHAGHWDSPCHKLATRRGGNGEQTPLGWRRGQVPPLQPPQRQHRCPNVSLRQLPLGWGQPRGWSKV